MSAKQEVRMQSRHFICSLTNPKIIKLPKAIDTNDCRQSLHCIVVLIQCFWRHLPSFQLTTYKIGKTLLFYNVYDTSRCDVRLIHKDSVGRNSTDVATHVKHAFAICYGKITKQ